MLFRENRMKNFQFKTNKLNKYLSDKFYEQFVKKLLNYIQFDKQSVNQIGLCVKSL